MTGTGAMPPFLHAVVSQLRRRGLPIGVDDCDALRQALTAGFGLASDMDLRNLCVALWAKSPEEAEMIHAVFARVDPPDWVTAAEPGDGALATQASEPTATGFPGNSDRDIELTPLPDMVGSYTPGGLPPWPPLPLDPSLVLLPHYPVTDREVAQVWRRLRRPYRHGPRTELDTAATIDEYCRSGVVTPPVLVPRRRNTASLLMLLDRQGSMTPYHDFVDYILTAIGRAGRLDMLKVAYFHNIAGRSGSYDLLARLPNPVSSMLDSIVTLVPPLPHGRVYDDADLTVPMDLAELCDDLSGATGVVVISDAGAARGATNTTRVLDTIAMLKTAAVAATAWLNPLPEHRWRRSTAAQIARHIPMFTLTREGMHHAVDVLRGQPFSVERPL